MSGFVAELVVFFGLITSPKFMLMPKMLITFVMAYNPPNYLQIKLSVSVLAQQSAFAIGVLSDLNAFHRSTGNFLCPYHTPAW